MKGSLNICLERGLNTRRVVLALSILFALCSLQIAAQSVQITGAEPAWLLRSLGRQARLDYRLSDAFFLLNTALEKDPSSPETLSELALSYKAGADYVQAEVYFTRALEQAARLGSPEYEYFILYELAELYDPALRGAHFARQYEEALLRITAHDSEFSSREDDASAQRRNMQALLNAGGAGSTLAAAAALVSGRRNMDRLLELYRIPDSFSLSAHVNVGAYYVHSGRYNDAQLHLLFAVAKQYTQVISALRSGNADFVFSTSEDLFLRVEEREDLLDYLRNAELDRALFYLAAASFGYNPSATSVYLGVWELVSLLPFESVYTERARERMQNPVREALRFASAQFLEEVNAP